jgi:hypothetical protein
MSNTNSFISLLSVLAGGVFSLLKINSLQRRELRKLQDLKIAHALFDKFETDFEKQFFENEWKEACFYMRSGIKNNYISIPQCIRLKDNLGLNFTWTDIRKAKMHLDLKNDDIKINLKGHDRIQYSVAVLIFVLSLLTTPFLLNSVFQLKIQELPFHLGLTLLCFVPVIVAYVLVLSTEPR